MSSQAELHPEFLTTEQVSYHTYYFRNTTMLLSLNITIKFEYTLEFSYLKEIYSSQYIMSVHHGLYVEY